METYQKSDLRSLELHRLCAQKLRENPLLVEKALDNIERWRAQNKFGQPYLEEWEALIKRGMVPLLEMMESSSEEAARLRSSSPFVGLISQEERAEIFKRFG